MLEVLAVVKGGTQSFHPLKDGGIGLGWSFGHEAVLQGHQGQIIFYSLSMFDRFELPTILNDVFPSFTLYSRYILNRYFHNLKNIITYTLPTFFLVIPLT